MSSYIDSPFNESNVCWRDFTWQRLVWFYGYDRAHQIDKGNDPDTQADLARWSALGRRAAA